MLQLTDREWKEFKVTDILPIVSRGKRLTKANRVVGSTPLITAGFLNYGVGEYISNPEQKRYSNAITIDMFGNTFYRGTEFCCDDNIIVLQNDNISEPAKLFLTALIDVRKTNFNYGNQYRLGDLQAHIISVPVNPQGQPDYDFMEQYIKEREPDYSWATGCIEPDAEISLSDRDWAEFQIGSLFTVEQGKGKIDRDSLSNEHTGFKIATASTTDNGIVWSHDEQNAKKRSGNTITIGRQTGVAFYQPDEYFETDNILILTNNKINRWSGLFVVGSYNNSTASKFCYGRVASIGKIKVEYISLPITAEGKPDYDFMEQYMKSLPFSKVLE